MKRLIGALAVVLFFGACNNASNQQQEGEQVLPATLNNYYNEVVAKHDTAMLLMKDIKQVQARLRKELKVITAADSMQKDTIMGFLLQLQKADDSMMDWMRYFKSTELDEDWYRAAGDSAINVYLQTEEQKIEQVHIDMLNSIRAGRTWLEK